MAVCLLLAAAGWRQLDCGHIAHSHSVLQLHWRPDVSEATPWLWFGSENRGSTLCRYCRYLLSAGCVDIVTVNFSTGCVEIVTTHYYLQVV